MLHELVDERLAAFFRHLTHIIEHLGEQTLVGIAVVERQAAVQRAVEALIVPHILTDVLGFLLQELDEIVLVGLVAAIFRKEFPRLGNAVTHVHRIWASLGRKFLLHELQHCTRLVEAVG